MTVGRASAAALLATAAACGSAGTGKPSASTERGAAELLATAEATLLNADYLQVRSEIIATGAVDAKLKVAVDLHGRKVRFAARGTFAGKPVDTVYVSNGAYTNLGIASPAKTGEAIILGMTRMGLLHNVAVIVRRRPPDHANGGVADWVKPRQVERGAPRPGPAANEAAVRFQIEVAGQVAGTAEVWLDESRNVPTGRVQTVRFPSGTMKVNETYRVAFEPVEPVDFRLTPPSPRKPAEPKP